MPDTEPPFDALPVPLVRDGVANAAARTILGDVDPSTLVAGTLRVGTRTLEVVPAGEGLWVLHDVTHWSDREAGHALADAVREAITTGGAAGGLEALAGGIWPVAELWLDQARDLHRVAVWTAPSHAKWANEDVPAMKAKYGFPGQALARRRTMATADLEGDTPFIRKEAAARHGLRAALCVPLIRQDRPIGAVLLLGGELHDSAAVERACSHAAPAFARAAQAHDNDLSDARVRTWTEHASDALFAIAPDGVVAFASKSTRDVTGRSAYDFVKRPFRSFVHADDREAVEGILTSPGRARFRLRSEATRWLEATSREVEDPPELVLVMRDVTQQVALEDDLQRSNQELEQFAYAASHDLQAPLRAISGYLQILAEEMDGNLSQENQHCIDRSVAAAERMRSMIQALLSYSRVGTRGAAFEPVDLNEAVAHALENLGGPDADIQSEELPTLQGDIDQLTQLFQNLFENALKFVEGPAKVRVTATHEPGWHRIAVEDNGPGIPANQRDKVFRIFQRLHRRDQAPGTGIGLALCRRIVERHGGRIDVDPNATEGARFFVLLPDGGV